MFMARPVYRNEHGYFNYIIHEIQNKRRRTMELTITNEQKIKLTLIPVTPAGKPTVLDGPPSWSLVSGNSTVEAAEDGLSAFLISEDSVGDTSFLVEADADLGEGKETIQEVIVLHVGHARAASLGLSAGTPVLK